MSDIDLDAIEKRANDATEGPWVAEYSGEQGNCVIPNDAESTREAVAVTRLYDHHADAEFIAHARTDIPALLADDRRLRLEVSILQTTLREVIAAGEAYKATVERAQALIPEFEKRYGIQSSPVSLLRDALDPT